MNQVAVLFARSDSNYKKMPICDVWDKERDARNWSGGCPVVAHPPCRAWGQLRQFAKPEPGEKELAVLAVDLIRKNGGVLEHPKGSTLWLEKNLPRPGQRDEFGGFTFHIDQYWFGHKAKKETFLYMCGCRQAVLRDFPISFGWPTHVVNTKLKKGQPGWRPEITKAEREHTPPLLAEWLVETALLCGGAQDAH
jgi:hypothetical protein